MVILKNFVAKTFNEKRHLSNNFGDSKVISHLPNEDPVVKVIQFSKSIDETTEFNVASGSKT